MCFALSLDFTEQEQRMDIPRDTAMGQSFREQSSSRDTSTGFGEVQSCRKRVSSSGEVDEPLLKKMKTADHHDSTGNIGVVDLTGDTKDGKAMLKVTLSETLGTPIILSQQTLEKKTSSGDSDLPSEVKEQRQDIEQMREKFNRILKHKRELLRHSEAELKAVEIDRESWKDRAIESECTQEAFLSENKQFRASIRKRFQESIRSEFSAKLKRTESNHAERLAVEKDKFEGVLSAKEEASARKLEKLRTSHSEKLSIKDSKIEEAEAAVAEAKHLARQTEREIRAQHKDELRKTRHDANEAARQHKTELKTIEATVAELQKDKASIEKNCQYFQEQWSLAQKHNDKLADMVRLNSRKVLELQNQVVEWKRNATEFQLARDELQNDFKAKLKANDEKWYEKFDVQYKQAQQSNSQLAIARQGVKMLSHANDQNIAKVKELTTKPGEAANL